PVWEARRDLLGDWTLAGQSFLSEQDRHTFGYLGDTTRFPGWPGTVSVYCGTYLHITQGLLWEADGRICHRYDVWAHCTDPAGPEHSEFARVYWPYGTWEFLATDADGLDHFRVVRTDGPIDDTAGTDTADP